MNHRHHLKPKHSGGEDSEKNLTPPIPVVRHAMFHWCEWQRTGNEFDRIAWRSLSGLIAVEESRILANKEWHKRKLEDGSHHLLPNNRHWDQREASRKSAQTSLERGTLNLLRFNTSEEHSTRVSNHQRKLVEQRVHHFLRGNETWDRVDVARENAMKQVKAGTLPLLSGNRTWDEKELAKKTRSEMPEQNVKAMVRKQTVSRRINSGWNPEKMRFIQEHLPMSQGKLLKLCQTEFNWPSSKGVIQNVLRAIESEGVENLFKLSLIQ